MTDSWTSDGLAYVMSQDTITVVMPNGDNKVVRKQESERYAKVIDAIRENDWEGLIQLMDIKTGVKNFGAPGQFTVRDDAVYVDGEALPDALSNRIVAFVREGLPPEPLLKFWANLQLNPSYRAVNDLYAFLEVNKHPITPDGCFIAYRGVTADWKDGYTQTMDNSIGAVVKQDRNKCDENPEVTCSKGLHAAGFAYAHTSYGSGNNGHTVVVKVHPRDVVAIPVDYHNAKMRVCRFEILAEVTQDVNDRPLYDDEPECLPERELDRIETCSCSGDTDPNEDEDCYGYSDDGDDDDDDDDDEC